MQKVPHGALTKSLGREDFTGSRKVIALFDETSMPAYHVTCMGQLHGSQRQRTF